MQKSEFVRKVKKAFLEQGFKRERSFVTYALPDVTSPDVRVIVSALTGRGIPSIYCGFWLNYDGLPPAKLSPADCGITIEATNLPDCSWRLFNRRHRSFDEVFPAEAALAISLIPKIADCLKSLLSYKALKTALDDGTFKKALVRKEVRQFLMDYEE